jgi:quercetin dioxygenase-like cupin family protein
MRTPLGHSNWQEEEKLMSQRIKTGTSDAPHSRRDLLRILAAGAVTVTTVSSVGLGAKSFAASLHQQRKEPPGVRAYKLYTGPDNASRVLKGTINPKDRADVVIVHFEETPALSSLDWHNTPEPQFVITLSGTLEFTTRDGETFVLRPGDVLLSEDNVGSGHKWRLTDDQPWRRAYIVLKPGAKDLFLPSARTTSAL